MAIYGLFDRIARFSGGDRHNVVREPGVSLGATR